MRGLRWALVGILAVNAALTTIAVFSTPLDPTAHVDMTRAVGLLISTSLAAVLARGRGVIWIIALVVCILACAVSLLAATTHSDRVDQWAAWAAAGFGVAVLAIVGLRFAWPIDSQGAPPATGVDEEQDEAADAGPHRS
jgi:hypothetical protein